MRVSLAGFAMITLSLVAALSDSTGADAAGAPRFAPGDIIIGYRSTQDREDAVKEINAAKDSFTVRGDEKADGLVASPMGSTGIKLHIEMPVTVRGDASKDPNAERKVLEDLATKIKESDARVKYAHPNWILDADPPAPVSPLSLGPLKRPAFPKAILAGPPNDFAFVHGLNWDYEPPPIGMNARAAWAKNTGSRDIVVAVIDTGILYEHPDIKGSGNVLPGYNFISPGGVRNADATDLGDACPSKGSAPSSWHGTHVAATIGAEATNNASGGAGINWQVSVLPIRALGPCGGTISDISDAVRWAAGLPVDQAPNNKHPADVINMSLGINIACTEENVGLLIDAINAARAAGATIVVAAGNDTKEVKGTSPGGCDKVISVAASDRNGHLAWYSNFGNVTIMAPGGDKRSNNDYGLPDGVWSLVKVSATNPDGIEPKEGTSMAAPHVAGAIALALAEHREWRHRPDVIEQKLRSSAFPLVPGACPNPCGVGQLDAAKLLAAH
jgi:subtilisin family serine protease